MESKNEFKLEKGWVIENLSLRNAENGVTVSVSMSMPRPLKYQTSWKSKDYVFENDDLDGAMALCKDILTQMGEK